MPPEFERNLEDLEIPYATRTGDITVVEGHELAIRGWEFPDAHALTQLLLFIANNTDAQLVTNDGDHYEFGPKTAK